MKNIGWILLAFILGTILAGCARDRLTIVVRSVEYVDGKEIEFGANYEMVSDNSQSRNGKVD